MQRQVILISALLAIRMIAAGQNPEVKGSTAQGPEDVGNLKVQAEGGNAQAQLKLANAYLASAKPAEARRWYEAAAEQNSAEGQFQLGSLLLTGKRSPTPAQSVMAEPNAAVSWIYAAATNSHRSAWRHLARCLQTGNGCATNLPEAYAWFTLLADTGDPAGRTEMNQLGSSRGEGRTLARTASGGDSAH